MLVLAAVAGEHVLVLGPPGTAKSEAVRRVANALGGRYFEYLLGRFTEPSELFGPVNLLKLREGLVETDTGGMLPEAEVAFLDEIFQGSTAILNTLLGLLNERVFIRGHTRLKVPLRLCVGASNALPTDESLAAFADRFLLRVFVEPVSDPSLEELLTAGWRVSAQQPRAPSSSSLASLDELAAAARAVNMDGTVPVLAEAVRKLRAGGTFLSDRRLVRAQRLIAAAAALDGRTRATIADLWPLVYVMPTAESQSTARNLLGRLLSESDSSILQSAADEASRGPEIRARRLVTFAETALGDGGTSAPDQPIRDDAWRLKVEALLRDIDAGFAPEARSPELTAVRERLRDALPATPNHLT